MSYVYPNTYPTAVIFLALYTFRLTLLRMRDKCKINVQRNDKVFMV